MDCVDNYTHTSPHIMYFPRSIPTKEVEETIEPSTVFCHCQELCSAENNCPCLQFSGSYYFYENINDLETYVFMDKGVNKPTFECNEQCGCINKLCGNKLAQCGPRLGLTVKVCKDNRKGEGVFAEKPINLGNFICEYAGEIISETEASSRFKINTNIKRMNYIFCIDEHFGDNTLKTFIDPTFYGNIGRYINHSCDPNSVMVIIRINDNIPVLCFFACKDIQVGDEISYDYGTSDLGDEVQTDSESKIRCLCGSENCKKVLPYDSRIK